MKYECINCGYQTASWFGRCPECGEWSTLKTINNFASKLRDRNIKPAEIKKIAEISSISKTEKRIKTGIKEFDRVLGGGIVKGSVILFTGDPGVGKSTLLLQVAKNISCLYVSAEESLEFISDRIKRLKINSDTLYLTDEKKIEKVLKSIPNNIDLLIIDSIQTVFLQSIESPAGSILQIKAILDKLISFAKSKNIAVILVGHKTKTGDYAGPKTLEHMVDVVLNLQGERNYEYRILSSLKNRFATTSEIGMFKITEEGLKENFDPLIFVDNPSEEKKGRALTVERKGGRLIFYEIQSLVVPTFLSIPRRIAKGLDIKKLLLLLAVIKKYLNISLDKYDIYVSTIGGINVKSSLCDLAITISILSSLKNYPTPSNTVFLGEIDLLGKVRKPPDIETIKKMIKKNSQIKVIDHSYIQRINNIPNFLLNFKRK